MPVLNFDYKNATRIVFGKGQIAKLTELVPKDKKILMCYGGGSIKRNGVYDQVMTALKGWDITEFSGIEANPDYETLIKAVAIVKELGPENVFVLSVGGGSVADGCKFVCAAAVYTKSTDYYGDICQRGVPIEAAVPLGVVLTLPATGSESNGNAVISYRAKHMKYCMASPLVYPVWAILDPETTMSLPTRQTANGVVDSCVHVCEQYVTDCINADVQDRYSEALLKVLIDNGALVMKEPNSYVARANIMWAAMVAQNNSTGVGRAQDWGTHHMDNEIGILYGASHGAGLALLFPYWMMYAMKTQGPTLFAKYASRVWGIPMDFEHPELTAMEGIKAFQRFVKEDLGMPTTISELGGKEEDIPKMVENMFYEAPNHGNFVKLTPEIAAEIYKMAL